MKFLYKNSYLISRRISQFLVLFLMAGGNWWGWKIVRGNYSSAEIMGLIKVSDPFMVLQITFTGFWIGSQVVLSSAIVLMFYTIISGRMFCSWICPINPVSDLARWLRRKLQIHSNLLRIPKNFRYWILGLSLLLSAITGIAAFESISPIGFLNRQLVFFTSFGWNIILILFLFDLGVLKNGWCGYLCPLGSFYSLVGRVGLVKVKHEKEKCTLCNKCTKVCPEPQVLGLIGKQSHTIKNGQCTNCARCIEVCDDKALRFSFNTHSGNRTST